MVLRPERNRLRHFLLPFFFLYGAIGVIFPFYTLWLKDWGLSDAQVAMIASLNGVAVIALSQVWGYAGDMLLSRKTLLLFNAFLAIVFFSILPWMQGFFLLALTTFAFSLFVTPNAQLLNSLLLSHPGGERHYSVVRSAGTLGFILVNLVIGWMSQKHGTAIIFPCYGATLGFFVLSMAVIRERPKLWDRMAGQWRDRRWAVFGRKASSPLSAPRPAARTATGTATDGGGASPAALGEPRRLGFLAAQAVFWHRPIVRRFLLFVLVYQVSHALSHHFQGLWIRELGGGERKVAYAYSLAAGAELLVFWVSDRLLASRSAASFLRLAAYVQVVRWGMLFLFPNLWVTMVSNSLHAITFGLFYVSAVVYMNRLSPAHLRTTGQTLLGLAYFGFAALASNLIGAGAIGLLGLRAWYGVATILGVVAVALALRIAREDFPSRDSG